MNRWTTVLLAALSCAGVQAHDHDHAHGAVPVHQAQVNYILNKGQWDSPVLYKAELPGMMTVFLEREGLLWTKLQDDAADLMHDHGHAQDATELMLNGHAWRMRFEGASTTARTEGAGRRTSYHNYFMGNDASKWAGHVPLYSEVVYRDLWAGVDLRLHSGEGQFKYDILLAKGEQVGSVRFRYEGLEAIGLGEDGRLQLRTSVGTVTEMHPVAWYTDGAREAVQCHFTVEGDRVGFAFARGTDLERPITIDPLLIASTLSGSTGASNYGHCATYDDAGNIYTGARNFGPSYMTVPGSFQLAYGGGGSDMVFSKYVPDGSALVWASYLGGSGAENPHSMIVNASQELCVLGSSSSANFPTTAGCYDNTLNGQSDMTVTVFSASGATLVGSTYIGGSGNDALSNIYINYGDSYRGEIMLDAAGNVFVASCTSSPNFPTTAGAFQTALAGGQDGVVLGITPNCTSLLWSTLLGSSDDDIALGIRFNSAGDAVVCGIAGAANFPSVPGGFQSTYQGGTRDGFVLKIAPGGGALTAATFFGTNDEDNVNFVDLDSNEDIYIYGQSSGSLTIQPAGTFGQAGGSIFIAKMSSDLTTDLVTSTLGTGGGNNDLAPVAFLVDVCDHVYISGFYSTSGLPTTPNLLYATGSFYLAAFDVDMAGLLFGTYYGGSHVDGGTSRFDKDGIIYQGVCSGTGSLQTTPWAHATTQSIGWDIGVFKIDFQVAGVNAAGAGTLNQGCAPILIDFLNTSTGNQWIWDFGDGSPLDTSYAPSHTYTTPGSFTVTLVAFDSLSCNLADTITFPVTIGQAQPLTADFTLLQNTDCTVSQVSTTNLSTGTPLAFIWDMGDGTFLTDTNVVHNYAGPGTYDVELVAYDPTGCSQPDSLTIPFTVLPPDTVAALFTVSQVPDCSDLIVSTTNNSNGPGPITYSWNMGNGTFLSGQDVTYTYTTPGTYTITLVASDANTCNLSDTLATQIDVDPTTPVVAGFSVDQVFDCAQLVATTANTSTGSFMGFSWDLGDGSPLVVDTNITHTYTNPGTYTVTLVVSDLLGCSPSDTATATLVVDPLVPVVADFTLTQVDDCTLLQVEGINQSTGDSVSYSWNMGDGTVLNTTDVAHSYSTPGIYNVTLTVTDLGCGQDDQMSMQVNVINTIPVAIATTGVICPGEVATLDGTYSQGGATYLWSTGQPMPLIQVWTPGQYILEVTTANCTGTDTVDVVEAPELELSSRFSACPDEELMLTVPIEGTSYSWNTGANDRDAYVVGPGEYIFTVVSLQGCTYVDTITVDPLFSDARLYAPNAFTPDGDGVNDVWSVTGYGDKEVELTVFNRWGQQVYATNSLLRPWDGTFNGQPVKQDVYVYVMKYNAVCQQEVFTTARGHVSVLR